MKMNLVTEKNLLRPNNKLVSSASEPVYTVSISSAADASRKGALYSVNLDPATLKAKGTTDGIIAICITNPPDSKKSLYLSRIFHGFVLSGNEDTSIDIDILKDGTWTGSSTLTPYNRNFGYNNRGVTTINYVENTNTAPLSAGTLISTRRSAASSAQLILEINGEIIVPPAHACTIKVSNSGSKVAISSLSVIWWEY